MRRGQIIMAEEALSLLITSLALVVLLSSFLILNRRTYSDVLDERMYLVSDNIADLIAKKYMDSNGNVDLARLNTTIRENVEVIVGTTHFGSYAPDNVNVYSVRRLVFVHGQPSEMEVRVWP